VPISSGHGLWTCQYGYLLAEIFLGGFAWEGESNTTKLPLYPTSPIYPHGFLNGGELATEVEEMAQNGSTQFWIRMSSSTTGQKQKLQQDSFETNSILKI
jgi:hypothetical protein